jgi:hypothetical protein
MLAGVGALVYLATRDKASVSGVPLERMPANGFGGSGKDTRMSGPVASSFKTCRGPGGSFGCIIGVTPELGVVGYGNTPPEALHTTAAVASDLAAALDEHPEFAAVLPGGPALSPALRGIALASQALKEGHTIETVNKVVGPATAKLVAKLVSLF